MDRTCRRRERFSQLSAEIALGSDANVAQHAQSRRDVRRSPGRAEVPTIDMGCNQRMGFIAAIVVACFGASLAQAETVFRIGNVGEPGSLDPQQISSTYENRVVGDMFLGLTTEAADGSMVPGAAESWTIDDDGRVYTFKLRDHKWSDGQTVTADDFVFAFRRVLEPSFAGIYASLLYPVQNAEKLNTGVLQGMEKLGVRALDEGTLQITLESPTPYFLELLTNFVAFPVPKHTVEQLGNDWAKPGAIVGNGAYVVTEWIPNTQVVLVKNAAFYDAANVSIDKVIYYADENQEALVKRFRAREVDYAANFPAGQIDWLRENLPAAVRISPHQGINYYVINVRDRHSTTRASVGHSPWRSTGKPLPIRSSGRRDSGIQLRASRHEQLWGADLSRLEDTPTSSAWPRRGAARAGGRRSGQTAQADH